MEVLLDKPLSDELSERLERLERECHSLRREMGRWRGAGVTVFLIGVLLLAIAGAQKAVLPHRHSARHRRRCLLHSRSTTYSR
jgi:hypothetical protein